MGLKSVKRIGANETKAKQRMYWKYGRVHGKSTKVTLSSFISIPSRQKMVPGFMVSSSAFTKWLPVPSCTDLNGAVFVARVCCNRTAGSRWQWAC